jgi:hypothetical protein
VCNQGLVLAGETVPPAIVQRAFLAVVDGTFGRLMNADEIVPLIQTTS